MKKIKALWESLDADITIRRRELFLELLVCSLAGILWGMLFSPKKTVTISSNNSGSGCNNSQGANPEEEGEV